MKKLKLMGLMVFIGVVMFIGSLEVKAANLTREGLSGMYGIVHSDDWYSFPAEIYRMDGRIAYCLEAGVHITSYTYEEQAELDFLSEEDRNYIKLVSYYGFGYPGHNDAKYYLATQELIWERASLGSESYWVTTQEVHGERIDVEREKNEILTLMDNPNMIKPSFDEGLLVVKKGDNGELIDSNNVLSDFELVDDYGGMVKIDGNKLVVSTDSDIREVQVELKKKHHISDPVLWYYMGDSQKMVSVGIQNEVSSRVRIRVNGGQVKVKKLGEFIDMRDGKYVYFQSVLDNVLFGVYANGDIITEDGVKHYSKGDRVLDLLTDDLGLVTSDYLYEGDYCLKEEKSSNGNMVDNENHCFTISSDNDAMVELELVNYLPTGEFIFLKFDEDTKGGIADTVIEIYNLDDKLVFTGKTDEEGKIHLSDLLVGKYYLVEKEASIGYVWTDKRIYFEIKENGQVVREEMGNAKIEEPPEEPPKEEPPVVQKVEVPITGRNCSNMLMIILWGIGGYVIYVTKQRED